MGVSATDFSLPCLSIIHPQPHYSDISDEEIMDFETIQTENVK